MKLLYVEDDLLSMRLVEKFLRNSKFELIWACDGQAGLETAIEELPTLILMDINLPHIDGLNLTRMLRDNPATKDIPIIALTSHNLPEDKERCLAAGCDDYLAKPPSRSELINVIEHQLSK
jgi:two-component system, cell cycle response regulator DivK